VPSIFKPVTIAYRGPDGRKCHKDTPGAVKLRIVAKVFYGRYKDAGGRRVTVPLCPGKRDSETLLAKYITDAKMERADLAPIYAEHRNRALTEHVDAFQKELLARNNTPKHAQQTVNRAKAVIDGCNFRKLSDVQASQIAEWLADERRAGRLSITTSNYYLRDAKSFFAWMVRDRRAESNPVEYLKGLNTATEAHRERRSLSAAEFKLFIEAAAAGETMLRLSGIDRALLYLVTSSAGFRAQEMASLTPESFALDGDAPTLTVEASYSKHKREDVQPIRADLAELLAGWLEDKPGRRRLWPGQWWAKAAKMVRADLQTARAKWIKAAVDARDPEEAARRKESSFLAYADSAGRVFDFHALRGQFISGLEAAGVTPKILQTLARHADIKTTLKHYAHVQLADVRGTLDRLPALPKLPGISGAGPTTEAETLPATGTDGQPVRTRFVHFLRRHGASGTVREHQHDEGSGQEAETEREPVTADEGDCVSVMAGEGEEAPPGFEPGMADLQSAALAAWRRGRESR